MDRVIYAARAARSYEQASTGDEKTAAEAQLVRYAAPLPQMLLWVSDWGLAMYDAYGGIEYPAYYAPTVAATTHLRRPPRPQRRRPTPATTSRSRSRSPSRSPSRSRR